MFCQLPLPYRRKTCYSELPSPPAGRSLEDTLRAFRQKCTFKEEETAGQNWEWGRCYLTHAGFRVRNKAEKIIADFLTTSGHRLLYEPPLRVGGVFMRPDFYVTDYGLPYEHFGFAGADYLLIWFLRTRFSVAKYSFRSRSS
jgi:hypothetical protein